MKTNALWLPMGLLCVSLSLHAQTQKIKLWTSMAPGTENRTNTEQWPDSNRVVNVFQPDLTVFMPGKSVHSSTAVIVCPGGGYRQVMMKKEGSVIARWLNENGITAFVLKYRLNPDEALRDAQRAVGLIRSMSKELNINVEKIGLIGFSAGAHLAANLVTHPDVKDKRDKVDSTSCRPDFWIGIYGSYDSIRKRIDKNSPPAFLVHAGNDDRVPVEQSLDLYAALHENGVPAELHVYEQGSHGFALETDRGEAVTGTVKNWSGRCIEWLKSRGLLSP